MVSRYKAHGAEGEFEPGSRGRVLKNLLGIRSVREMGQCESEALLAVTLQLIDEVPVDRRFTSGDLRRMHRLWLGEIYPWAGDYRHVNLAKGKFMFAAAGQIPGLMKNFERGLLSEFTPCHFVDMEDQARALAVVHAELVLIHPFRDGNGRCARLLATLMGLQAGLPALDFSGVRGREKRRYIDAIHAGVGRDYGPMIAVFRRIISRTLKSEHVI